MARAAAKAPDQAADLGGFTVEMWPIERPIPYARNPRNISEAAISKVAGSLLEFGFRQPIVVDPDGVVVVGHTRLQGAQRLGLTHVPVHVAHGLTPNQIRAYRLADNRVGEESTWADELLGLELADLKEMGADLGIMGFDAGELTALLGENAPTLDDLSQEWGDHDEETFWPEIKLKVAPETFSAYERLLAGQPGENDAERFAALLALADDAGGRARDAA